MLAANTLKSAIRLPCRGPLRGPVLDEGLVHLVDVEDEVLEVVTPNLVHLSVEGNRRPGDRPLGETEVTAGVELPEGLIVQKETLVELWRVGYLLREW